MKKAFIKRLAGIAGTLLLLVVVLPSLAQGANFAGLRVLYLPLALNDSTPSRRTDPNAPTATPAETVVRDDPPAPTATVEPPPATEWLYHKTTDGAHPNGAEQQMMWLMQRARADPAAEGVWLVTLDDPSVAAARAFFDVDLAQLQAEFADYAPQPPAAFDLRLYQAAKAHSEDLIARDAQDHDQQFAQVEAAGFVAQSGRGNVFAYADSALAAHAAWNIDWGGADGGMQEGRPHRSAVMALDGEYTNVGIAVVAETDPGTGVGPLVVTGNYMHAGDAPDHYNRFIVGTVWRDLNGNALYDPGEGIGGVTVRPDHGDYFAVTADGGGYAIPVTAPGVYRVHFVGATTFVHTVTVSETSVLLDWRLAP